MARTKMIAEKDGKVFATAVLTSGIAAFKGRSFEEHKNDFRARYECAGCDVREEQFTDEMVREMLAAIRSAA